VYSVMFQLFCTSLRGARSLPLSVFIFII